MEIAPLTDTERSDLKQLEQTVEKNFVAWMKAGFALREIRDRKLYRVTHPTFEKYTKDRFDVARSTAYQLISGVQVIENVRNADKKIPFLPEKEALVRPLTRLEADEQPEAWRLAIGRAMDLEEETVMARHVAWAVNLMRPTPEEKVLSGVNDNIAVLPPEFKEAYQTITEIIYAAKQKRFVGIDRVKMLKIIDGWKRMIEG